MSHNTIRDTERRGSTDSRIPLGDEEYETYIKHAASALTLGR